MSDVGARRTANPVLLLHGQPGTRRDWERVQAAIGERAATIAFDRPGWDGARPASDLEANAQAAVAALDAEGIGRATVAGHSFGAAVAAWLAAGHPERVASLVLAAPSANGASLLPLDHLLAAPLVGFLVGASVLGATGAALAAPPVRRRIAERLRLDDGYLRATGRVLLDPSTWRAFGVEQRMLLRDLPLLEARLGQITAPTTIAIGTDDFIVPAASARLLSSQIPGARLVELERASHLLPQLRPARLAEIILAAASRA